MNLVHIAPLNSNSQYPLSNLKGIYNAKQELVPIKKYEKCYIQAITPQKTPLPISGMVKAKPIQYVQEKYNLSSYKHLQLYDNESHCP